MADHRYPPCIGCGHPVEMGSLECETCGTRPAPLAFHETKEDPLSISFRKFGPGETVVIEATLWDDVAVVCSRCRAKPGGCPWCAGTGQEPPAPEGGSDASLAG